MPDAKSRARGAKWYFAGRALDQAGREYYRWRDDHNHQCTMPVRQFWGPAYG